MGTVTTSVGLVSGLPTADIINQLLAIEARPVRLLESRITELQAERAAFLDVSARLLAIKNAIASLAKPSFFKSASATSSAPNILTASATEGAALGTFSFRVKSLVSNHQLLTRGFADADQTPVGGGTISIELGNGRVNRDTSLDFLNGQSGVRRGVIRVTDRAGGTSDVDLTTAQTVGDVLSAINSAVGTRVTASVRGDAIVLTDNTGATTGTLSVTDLGGGATAADLGIATGVDAAELIGTNINVVNQDTALRLINDGNGVRRRDEAAEPDFEITAGNGTSFGVTLTDDLLDTTQLAAVNDGGGVGLGVIRITDRTGASAEIDLTGAVTIADVVRRINDAEGVSVSAVKSGSRLNINDNSGASAANLIVEDVSGTAAADLGITGNTEATTLTGRAIYNVSSIGDVLRAINFAQGNDGAVVATLDAATNRIVLTDTTGGGGGLTVTAAAGGIGAAEDLGILGSSSGGTLTGQRLVAGLNSTLLRNLNGGAGVTADTLTVTNREGVQTSIDLSGVEGLRELLDRINTTTATSGISASVNRSGNGIALTDRTTGTGALVIADTQAAQGLGLVGSHAAATANGGNAQLRYVSEATRLADYNFGRGVAAGSIRVTGSTGASATIDLRNSTTIGDVLRTINGRVSGVVAEINENGDGIILRDTAGGTGRLTVTEAGGTTARDLNILGVAEPAEEVTAATALSELNDGAGVGLGVIRVTNRAGDTAEIDLSTAATLGDVLTAINGSSLSLSARLTSSRIEITDTAAPGDPPVNFKIEDVSGTAAQDLGIRTTSNSNVISGRGLVETVIDGSYEIKIDIGSSDTLNQIASKINGASRFVRAAVLNDGGASNPFHLSLTSSVSGRRGEIVLDGGDLDLQPTTLTRARDAAVLIGDQNAESPILITGNSNTLTGIVPGVTLNLLGTSEDPVEVTVSQNQDAIVQAVKGFVDSYNAAISRIGQLTAFDPETEQRGVLLSDPTVSRIRSALGRSLVGTVSGVDPRFSRLSSMGIRIESGGRLTFDEAAFRDLLESDRDAVEAFFSTEENGFAHEFETLLESFTDTTDGLISRQNETLQSRENGLNDRIASLNELLESKRTRLQREFAALETALLRLQSQQQSLGALSSLISTGGGSIALS